MVKLLKFGNRYVISSPTLPAIWLLNHAGIKAIIQVSKAGPWNVHVRPNVFENALSI